jgi:aerobic-type carbon monoxide dehydrogenase small subunit (CoxS/CutS family)
MSNTLTFTLNGAELTIDADPQATLLSVLRERFDLTGAKLSCGEGACGACTVLVGDEPVRSCITSIAAAAGKRVLTIEGLATPTMNAEGGTMNGQPAAIRPEAGTGASFIVHRSSLHPLQQAFIDADAFQCGYCTPGMIMAGVGLLLKHPDPDVETIVSFMQGNICRCGMYARIVRAIQQAAAELRADPAAGGER